MKKFFDEKPVVFAVILILIYVLGMSNVPAISEAVGVEFLAEAIFAAVLTAVIFICNMIWLFPVCYDIIKLKTCGFLFCRN